MKSFLVWGYQKFENLPPKYRASLAMLLILSIFSSMLISGRMLMGNMFETSDGGLGNLRIEFARDQVNEGDQVMANVYVDLDDTNYNRLAGLEMAIDFGKYFDMSLTDGIEMYPDENEKPEMQVVKPEKLDGNIVRFAAFPKDPRDDHAPLRDGDKLAAITFQTNEINQHTQAELKLLPGIRLFGYGNDREMVNLLDLSKGSFTDVLDDDDKTTIYDNTNYEEPEIVTDTVSWTQDKYRSHYEDGDTAELCADVEDDYETGATLALRADSDPIFEASLNEDSVTPSDSIYTKSYCGEFSTEELYNADVIELKAQNKQNVFDYYAFEFPVNEPPVITGNNPPAYLIDVNDSQGTQVEVSNNVSWLSYNDHDDSIDSLTDTVTSNSSGMTASQSGNTWYLDVPSDMGSYDFDVTLEDNVESETESFVQEVAYYDVELADTENLPASINLNKSNTATQISYSDSYTLEYADVFDLSIDPSTGASIDTENEEITFSQTGSYTLNYFAENSQDTSYTGGFTRDINVNEYDNAIPEITLPRSEKATELDEENETASYTLTGIEISDANTSDTLTVNATKTGDNASDFAVTKVSNTEFDFSYTGTQTGSYNVDFIVEDDNDPIGSQTQSFTWNVVYEVLDPSDVSFTQDTVNLNFMEDESFEYDHTNNISELVNADDTSVEVTSGSGRVNDDVVTFEGLGSYTLEVTAFDSQKELREDVVKTFNVEVKETADPEPTPSPSSGGGWGWGGGLSAYRMEQLRQENEQQSQESDDSVQTGAQVDDVSQDAAQTETTQENAEQDTTVQDRYALVVNYVQQNDLDYANTIAQNMVQNNPNSAMAWNAQGWVELEQGNLDAAKESLSKAIELNQDLARAYLNMGDMHKERANYQEAKAAYQKALDIASEQSFVIDFANNRLQTLDDQDSSTPSETTVPETQESDDSVQTDSQAQDASQVSETPDKNNTTGTPPQSAGGGEQKDTLNTAKGLYDSVRDSVLNTNYDTALEYAVMMTVNHPENALSWNALGWVYMERGSYDDAKESLLTALEKDASLGRVHYNLAQIYLNEEDYKKAQEHAQKATDLASKDTFYLNDVRSMQASAKNALQDDKASTDTGATNKGSETKPESPESPIQNSETSTDVSQETNADNEKETSELRQDDKVKQDKNTEEQAVQSKGLWEILKWLWETLKWLWETLKWLWETLKWYMQNLFSFF